jgi:UDP-glucose 4-epimerase
VVFLIEFLKGVYKLIIGKRIVITGGAGFVGSALCKALAADNEVISIDNYFTGTEKNHVNGVKYIRDSAENIMNLIDGRVHYVFHFGEYSRVEQSFEDADFVLKNNQTSLPSILHFCKEKEAKLIYSGSSTKFTKDEIGILQSPYAYSKASNTNLVNAYAAWFDLKYAITYFYNVYGPGEIDSGKYSTVVAKFMALKKSGKKLPVVKPGSQVRNFTHIEDIVSGLLAVAKNGEGDLYGIGSKDAFSIMELAQMFCCEIEEIPERKGNRMASSLETRKTEQLGWSAKNSLRQYIKENT